MNADQLRQAYQAFFVKSEAGRAFMESLSQIIAECHNQAEKAPELSRDLVQRAKGARQVLEHIQSVSADVKKGGYTH
jgi:uncharacterized protein YaaN involved in tellurite resistance